jgi:hypothetical protein
MNNQNYEEFNLSIIRTLSPIDAQKYIDKYIYPISDGRHAFLTKDSFKIYDTAVLKATYFNRMPKELQDYYFRQKIDLRDITFDMHKDKIFDNKINLCPKIIHTYKEYKTFSEETKKKVDQLFKIMFEILSDSKQEAYEYLLKWISNMCKGNRNDSALILKGVQGAGKSTIFEFLRLHVLKGLSYQGGTGPLKTKFNGELSCKLLVVFEELDNCSYPEWMAISSVLKRNITSSTIMIERKGLDAVEEPNFGNVALIANHDSIKDDDGRRYYILDICTKYHKNKLGEQFFKYIYDECFNDETGHAFYCRMLEIDTKGFYAQRFPITQSKIDSYSKRLDAAYQFIKSEYILKHKSIEKISVSLFHETYVDYCKEHKLKDKSKIEFNKTLSEVGIKYVSLTGNKNYYICSLESLNEIADKYNWIHKLDEYSDYKETKPTTIDNELELKIKDDKIKDLESKIIELENKLKQMETEKQPSMNFDIVVKQTKEKKVKQPKEKKMKQLKKVEEIKINEKGETEITGDCETKAMESMIGNFVEKLKSKKY